MKRLWNAWVALMDQREAPTVLALVRIAVSLVILADYVQIYLLDLVQPLFTVPPVGVAEHDATAWFWIGSAALICSALGLGTRVALGTACWASMKLAESLPEGDRSVDVALRVVLVILALSQSHARWSVDARLRRRLGRPFPTTIPAWPRYLLLFQLIWIYFCGGANKGGASWGPTGRFLALSTALTNPHYARFAPGWVSHVVPLTQLATFATMCFELGAPLYLLAYYYAKTPDRPGRLRAFSNRYRLRWLWIGTGLCFSFGIIFGLRLGIFSWGMLALYPVLY